MNRSFDPRPWTLAALALLAALGAALILYATPQGLSLSDDSIAYIAGARSLLGGQGYREAWLASNGPVTHFPPGFPAALAAVGLTGLDPLRGARLVNALAFGLNGLLLGLIGWRMTGSALAGILSAALFVSNASLLRTHAAAMSEPLYILLCLAALLALSQYFDRGRARWLALAGILAALGYLTRYAGLALLATILIALVLLQESWRVRFRSAAIFLGSSLPLMLGWTLRNAWAAENATNRRLVYHPLTAEDLAAGIHNFSEFLMPVEAWRRELLRVPNLFAVVLGVLFLALLLWVASVGLKQFLRPGAGRPEALSFLNGLYALGYLASIVATMLLFDASTKFKLRILAPAYVSLLVLLVWLGYWIWSRRGRIGRWLVIAASAAVLSASAWDAASASAVLHRGGQGYASFQWYDSEAMAFLRGLPAGTRIYTNQPGPVYLYTDRPAYVLPDRIDPVTAQPREGYARGVEALQEDVLSGEAVLALFKYGSEEEDVQTVYLQLAEGLFLGHESRGDRIFTAHP